MKRNSSGVKLYPMWFLLVCSCVFLLVGLVRLPLRAEEPKVTSTARPWIAGKLKGTQKITTEEFKDYTVSTIIGSARDPSAPANFWQSEHLVEYKDLSHKLLKFASLTESADLTDRVKKDSDAYLMWHEISGGRVSIRCKHTDRTDGGSFVDRYLGRTKPEDTSGCGDPKFPFQLLKEKPL